MRQVMLPEHLSQCQHLSTLLHHDNRDPPPASDEQTIKQFQPTTDTRHQPGVRQFHLEQEMTRIVDSCGYYCY